MIVLQKGVFDLSGGDIVPFVPIGISKSIVESDVPSSILLTHS